MERLLKPLPLLKERSIPVARTVGDPVRILLIGAGKMGAAHASALQHVPNACLAGIVSQSGVSAQKLALAHGLECWGTDWREVAENSSAQACIVAVSHLQNPSISSAVLEFGLHLLSEKPVAFDSASVHRLGDLARQKGLVNLAAVNRRFFPGVLRAINLADLHGPLLGITAFGADPVSGYRSTGKHDPFVYDNWTLFQTIHLIDVLRLIGGDVASVAGARYSGHESNLAAQITFENGLVCNYSAFSSARRRWEIYLHCDGFEIELNPLEKARVSSSSGYSQALYPTRKDKEKRARPDLVEQATLFVNSILDATEPGYPGSTFHDHAKTIHLIESLLALPERRDAVRHSMSGGVGKSSA